MKIENKEMKLQMDTGASCNILSFEKLKSTNFDLKLIRKTSTIIK